MRGLRRLTVLCLLVLFPIAAWSIPINRTETNRQQYPLIDQLTDALEARQIDTLFDFKPENAQKIERGARPRLAPLDDFPIGNQNIYDWVSPHATDLTAWQEAYRKSANQAVLAVESTKPGESPTLREFRAAWDHAPQGKRIFISFTSANEAQAAIVKELLTQRGYLVFTYRQNNTNVTSLADVFHFFHDAGNRFVIDSPEARASSGVQIEARMHEIMLQREGRGRAVKPPEDHETQHAKRARKVDRLLDTELAKLQSTEIAIEQRIARNPQAPPELFQERREIQQQVESMLKLRRTLGDVPPRKPTDPPEGPGLAPKPGGPRKPVPPPAWTNRADLKAPPPPPNTPSTGNYRQRVSKMPATPPRFKASLGRTPMLHFGGVIVGNDTAAAPKVKAARFDPKRPALVVEIDGKAGEFVFDAMTMTELWAAYHFLKPGPDQTAQGAKPGATGICGIDGNQGDHWNFVLHPAVANTYLARDAMRLDMVLAVNDRSLISVPTGWATYRWFDEAAVILADNKTVYVKAATEPHFTLMRVHLWADQVQMSVDTRYAVADLYYRFDALRRIDRFAKLVAVLRWLEAAGKLPALPAEVQPERISMPARWFHGDVLFDYAAVDRPLASGRDMLTAAVPSVTRQVEMSTGRTYTIEVRSVDFVPALRIEDAAGKVLAQNNPLDPKRGGALAFTPTQAGLHRVVVTSFLPGRTGAFGLTIQEAQADKEFQGKLAHGDPLVTIDNIQSYHHAHAVELKAGNLYSIELRSAEFDTLLRLEDDGGVVVAENDDIDLRQNNKNSRVVIEPARSGTYRIIATSFAPGKTGSYSVSVQHHQSVYPARDYGLRTDTIADDSEDKAGGGGAGGGAAGGGSGLIAWIKAYSSGLAVGGGLVIVACIVGIIFRRRRSD